MFIIMIRTESKVSILCRKLDSDSCRENQFYRNMDNEQNKVVNLDLSNCLTKSRVTSQSRANLLQWKIRVLTAIEESLDYEKLFKSIEITDHYLKNTGRTQGDQDLYLIGITSLFISFKYNNNYHLKIKNFIRRISPGRFKPTEITAKEFEIMKAVGFNISKRGLSFLLNYFLCDLFEVGSNAFIKIKTISHNFLLLMLLDAGVYDCSPNELILAVLCTAIGFYYDSKLKNGKVDFGYKKLETVYRHENAILKKIHSYSKDSKELKRIYQKIKNFIQFIQSKYKDYQDIIKLIQMSGDGFK